MHLPLPDVRPSARPPLVELLRRIRAWPQASQERSRRNAMLAATDCAQRRLERQEVEDFFVSRAPAPRERDAPRARAR